MATIAKTNVTMTSIYDALRSAGGSVTYDLRSFFSTDAKLNMWSKYKPVIWPNVLFHSLNEWLGVEEYADGGAYVGSDGKCGLTIPQYSDVSTIQAALLVGTAGWSYTPPTGGTTQPMRLGDFRGYCTTAYNPIGRIDTNGIADALTDCVAFNIDTGLAGTSDTNLTLDDIKIGGTNGTPLKNLYFGVFMYKSDGKDVRFQTHTKTIAGAMNDGTDMVVSIDMDGNYGDWLYAPFLSTIYNDGSIGGGTYISCNIGMMSISVGSASTVMYTMTANVSWESATSLYYEASITNNDSGQQTFTDVRLYITSGSDRQVENGLGTVLWASVSVDAGKTATTAGRISINRDYTKMYYSKVTCGTPQYTGTENGIDELDPEG